MRDIMQKPRANAMTSVVVSLIVWVVIMVGVFIGVLLRKTLPEHHLADAAKDVVRLGTALVSTIAALVLGLLIASANSSFETQSGEVKRMGANVILLDRMLAQYGPEARATRDSLRRSIDALVDRIWRDDRSGSAVQAPFEANAVAEAAFAEIFALPAQSEAQRLLKARAIEASHDIARTRLLLFEQADSAIPLPFLAVLVFWLAMIFASFSLFSRLNATLIAALAIFALSASGAIFLILELSQPFAGLMQISSEPLRHALAPL
jgi:hypothetical protein